MMEIAIPGFGNLRVEHLVCDFNGTLAVDGELIPGMREALAALACVVRVHVITADTFGRVASQLEGLPVDLTVIPVEAQAQAKLDYISRLGVETVVAIGNGLNDRDMLRAAAIGIALIQEEGASARTLACADIVCTGILDALDLLRKPKRLIATLRS